MAYRAGKFMKHNSSDGIYSVIGVGRRVERPNEEVVIYRQHFDTTLRETGVPLPAGSIWVREERDFRSKFTSLEDGELMAKYSEYLPDDSHYHLVSKNYGGHKK